MRVEAAIMPMLRAQRWFFFGDRQQLPPVVAHVADTQDEIERAVNAALALKDGGLLPGKLLVIHANSSLESALRQALERRLGVGMVF